MFHVSASSTLFSKDIQIHICVDIVFFILYYEHKHTFQELLALRKEYTQDDFASGRKNISANYTPSVLPGLWIFLFS